MCYIVPMTAAITTTFVWKKKKTRNLWWLLLLFYGNSLFGVIDHMLNGELFSISRNWSRDLFLGAVITAGTILAWVAILAYERRNVSMGILRETTCPPTVKLASFLHKVISS